LATATREDFRRWKEVFPVRKICYFKENRKLIIYFKNVESYAIDSLTERYIISTKKDGVGKSLALRNFKGQLEEDNKFVAIIDDSINIEDADTAQIIIIDVNKARCEDIQII